MSAPAASSAAAAGAAAAAAAAAHRHGTTGFDTLPDELVIAVLNKLPRSKER